MHPIERLRYVARSSGAPMSILVRETAGALGGLGFDPAGLVTACRRVLDRHPTAGPLWWLAARVLTTVGDPDEEGWRCADEMEDDPTVEELVHALPTDATVCVLGWPELAGEALARRGDAEVLAVDALDEGSGLVRRLRYEGVDAVDVPVTGLAAAVVSADLVLLEASATGPDALGGRRRLPRRRRRRPARRRPRLGGGRSRAPAARASVRRPAAGVSRRSSEANRGRGVDEVVPADLVDRVTGPVGPIETALALANPDCPVAAELLRAVPRL